MPSNLLSLDTLHCHRLAVDVSGDRCDIILNCHEPQLRRDLSRGETNGCNMVTALHAQCLQIVDCIINNGTKLAVSRVPELWVRSGGVNGARAITILADQSRGTLWVTTIQYSTPLQPDTMTSHQWWNVGREIWSQDGIRSQQSSERPLQHTVVFTYHFDRTSFDTRHNAFKSWKVRRGEEWKAQCLQSCCHASDESDPSFVSEGMMTPVTTWRHGRGGTWTHCHRPEPLLSGKGGLPGHDRVGPTPVINW